ncbi:MAG: DNA-deoxyinosine glycosylase [Burkholderiales bacterium PBB4]|nr:MAG: DNA-deoxyinosine glycosylase [Burkholderiales bacterium PBB4]
MSSHFAASFAPHSDVRAQILILGSIPGRESLKVGRYYAHPRNQFWKIMATLLGFVPDMLYADRLLTLQRHGIALWDVMHSCRRVGSLDSSIEPDSIEANDFASFYQSHTAIRAVFFNGAAAEATYHKQVLPKLPVLPLRYTRLPSTSPAHASLSFAQKLDAWRCVLLEI